MLKICIAGCGAMATSTHMPAVKKYMENCGGIDVLGCADINTENAKKFAEKFEMKSYFSGIKDMLDECRPDAVICLVSETAMCKVVCEILGLGYHVLFEKPPGKTKEEIEQIINCHKNSKKNAMVAFNRRYSPIYAKLKEIIGNDKIQHIIYNFHRIKRIEDHFEDTAIHAVDSLKWLADSDYDFLEIRYGNRPEYGVKVANYFLYCTFKNGITAQINIIVSTGNLSEGCEIYTEDNVYIADFPMTMLSKSSDLVKKISKGILVESYNAAQIGMDVDSTYSNGFYDEIKIFLDCFKNGIIPPGDPVTALQSVEICEGIKNRIEYIKW